MFDKKGCFCYWGFNRSREMSIRVQERFLHLLPSCSSVHLEKLRRESRQLQRAAEETGDAAAGSRPQHAAIE